MATKQFLMLDQVSMEYHTFRKDQVLTHTQLNELIDFFEDQDRLTRTCLSGVGLVCGLAVDLNSTQSAISVGKGCGVTTDGDLLVMDKTIYRDFRVYDNRKKGTNDPIYDPFFPANDGNKQLALWELVIPDSKGELPLNSKPLTSFDAATGNKLEDMTALLYLEYYLQDPDKCTAIDCDNQGPHQIAKIKVLLLSKADMQKVIDRDPADEIIADSIYKKYYNASNTYFDLPVIKARRVVLNATNTVSMALLAKSYTGIVNADGLALIKAIEDMYASFKFMIDAAGSTNINDLTTTFKQLLAANPAIYHSQYLYDFYKDIIAAYNELKNLLFNCMSECSPDRYAFPKHIMLGELKKSTVQPQPYRHDFYPSPAVGDNKHKIAKCRSMWLRMEALMQRFSIAAQPSVIRITPSRDYNRAMEDRAIPFYYKDAKSIVKNWNYELSKRGAEKSVLSYNAGEYAAGVNSSLHPLEYDIDSNDFFRIEGHLGKQLSQAMTGIAKIKDDSSIPFDLVAIRINKIANLKDINIDDFDCQFEDLNAILKAWLVEQNCLFGSIARFFSGFSTDKAKGFHTRIVDYQVAEAPVFIAKRMRKANIDAAPTQPGIRVVEEETYMATAEILERDMKVAAKPFCKTVYTIDKTIEDNLETEPGAMGNYFKRSMQPGYSAEDMIADVKYQTASDPQLATLTKEEREVVYEAPLTMVAHVTELSQMKPYNVDEITTDMMEKYMDRMERLCQFVKLLHTRMEKIFTGRDAASTNNYTNQGFESYYLFLIQQMIANCCAAEKLESLLEEINNRKKKILESLLFANYAKNHPGLEHKAGVHRGGTFVLLYTQQEKRNIRKIAVDGENTEFFLADETSNTAKRLLLADERELTTKERSTEVYDDIYSFASYLVTNQGKVNFDKEVATYKKANGIKSGTLQEEAFNKKLTAVIKEVCARLTKEDEAVVGGNVVIADFTLPYLCCSDCPPTAFIMPKQQYSLSLPKAAACNDEDLLEFRKEPIDGKVKTGSGLDKILVEKDGKTFFDPKQVPAASFGKAIDFSIDDQVTDCTIIVYKHPTAKGGFTVESQSETSITVNFTNDSDDATGKEYLYDWDFGNDKGWIRSTSKDPIVVIYKKSLLKEKNYKGTIPVILKATNGPCYDTVSLPVTYTEEQPVSLTLPKDKVCHDEPLLAFSPEPVNAVVSCNEVPAAVVKDGAGYSFDASKVPPAMYEKPLSFMANGKATACTIMVFKHPVPAFNATAVLTPGSANKMTVTFTNLTDTTNNNQLTYRWKFSDGTDKQVTTKATFTQDFDMAELKRLLQSNLGVMLFAINPGCSGRVEKTVDFPFQQIVAIRCIDIVKSISSTDLKKFGEDDFLKFLATQKTTPDYTAIAAQLKATKTIITNAIGSMDDFGKVTFQQSTLKRIGAQLLKLYNNGFSQNVNEIVIAPQVSALLHLALDIVRCFDGTLNSAVHEMLISIINEFIERIQIFKQRMPVLDKDQVLRLFLNDYINKANFKDPKVMDKIKELLKRVKDVF